MKKLFVVFALLVALFAFPSKAMAHSVWTDYQLKEQQLQLTTLFSTEEPFKDAPIKVYSPKSKFQPWLEGKTDEQGSFAFQPDVALKGNWLVNIGDGVDHADFLTVPVTESGVQVDKISQQDVNRPHWWARQAVVGLGAFGTGLGSAVFFRRRRWS